MVEVLANRPDDPSLTLGIQIVVDSQLLVRCPVYILQELLASLQYHRLDLETHTCYFGTALVPDACG